MPKYAFRIIKTEPVAPRQRELEKQMESDRVVRSVFKAAVRETIQNDPELRGEVEKAVELRKQANRRRHLERPIERGGGHAALLFEQGDGAVRRIDRNGGDPRQLKKSDRASFKDVLARPVWDGTRYVEKP